MLKAQVENTCDFYLLIFSEVCNITKAFCHYLKAMHRLAYRLLEQHNSFGNHHYSL